MRQELLEEYEQVKGIVGTLESFKVDKPADFPVPQSEEGPRDPAVWPPPTPAEHRYMECLRPNTILQVSGNLIHHLCLVPPNQLHY